MAKSSRRSAQSADNRMKKPQNRTGPAKPKAAFDLAGVAKLAVIQSTDQEIFDWFHGTIPRRILESKRFRQAIERGRSRGRVALRRLQFEAAQRHDPAMLRLLGEQWLGQKQMI